MAINYKVGTHILVRRFDRSLSEEPIEVEILDKAVNATKVRVLSHGYYKIGEVVWLDTWYESPTKWYAVGKPTFANIPEE